MGVLKNKRFIEIDGRLNLWTETFGDSSGEACLLISGAGANSTFWSEHLCEQLVWKGFFVVKYDHRDFGYSSKVDFDQNPFDVMTLAEDAISIMDSLKIEKAHIVGHSMGGFIAQILAIHYPHRVLSITSASSSTSSIDIPVPSRKTWEIFMKNNPTNNFEKDLPGFLEVWTHLNGTAELDKELAIEYTRNLYERQEISGAIEESHVKAQANLTDRTEELKQVNVPALVIHGEEDYLVDKYGGIQTAKCLRNSNLALIPKMGHLPLNKKILEQFENEIIRFLTNNKS